jgi:transposase
MDMRKGIDTLTLIAQALFKDAWQQSSAFLFRNRSGCRLKLLSWDQHGVWLCHRRLHRGRFIWPKAEDTSWTLTQAQFDWLIIGVDWQRLSAPKVQWQIF